MGRRTGTFSARLVAGRSISCCTILLLAWSPPVAALDPARPLAHYRLNVWQTSQGLPHNTVYSIIQTREGYIWFATDEGVVRFDGLRFRVFNKQTTPEIRSNQIQFLFESSDGSLWIGTAGGLTRLRDRRFAVYTAKEGLADDNVVAICEDRQGNLWIGTSAGLTMLKDGSLTTYTSRDGLPHDSIRSIYEDRRGRLWISTLGGLCELSEGRFRVFTSRQGLPHDSIKSVFEDSKGNLWVNTVGGLAVSKGDGFVPYGSKDGLLSDTVWSIHEDRTGALYFGTDRGLNRLSEGRSAAFTTADGLSHNSVWSIYEDSTGTLWLATPAGLTRFRDGKLSPYTTRQGLTDGIILAVYEDREGSLWIGTEAGGLNRLKDSKFTNFTTAEGLTSDLAWAVLGGQDGSLWIGTHGGGLNRIKDGVVVNSAPQVQGGIVRALYQDREGVLWLGTPEGLTAWRDGRRSTYTVEDGLSNNAVSAIAGDSEGNLWIGTFGGLTQLYQGRFRVYTTRDGLTDDNIVSLLAGSDGSLWIGTRSGGLNRLKDGRFTQLRAPEWAPEDSVKAIHEDRSETIWIGTRRSGLTRLKDGQFRTYTTRDGLFDDCVFRILEDGRQNLWMSSPKGVFRVGKEELENLTEGRIDRITSISYGTADGMASGECNGGQPAGCKTRDGTLWFPTVKGVTMIDPERLDMNKQPPPVVLEHAVIDNELVPLDGRLELGPGKERYEFHYAGLSFVAPEKVRFRYKLEGFDKDWIEAGGERVALYTHIPPGSYRFRVLAANNDGVWNETGASFELHLRPYFYQTFWFYLVCAATLGVVGLGLYRLRLNRIRAQFALVLEERNRLAREIHDTLAQGFVGIGLQLQAVEKALDEAPDAARRHLGVAQHMVSHSLSEARRTVWDLRAQVLESGDLAAALRETAQQMTGGTSVRAEVRVEGESRRLPALVENHLFRIGQEALTNALKHARPRQIIVELGFGADSVQLSVKDDGCGFDAGAKLQAAGGGLGLLGMQERVERLGGQLRVNSRAGGGTEITAVVPIK